MLKKVMIAVSAPVLALTLSLSSAAATAPAGKPGRLEFEVLRNGKPFGAQTIVVTKDGQALKVSQALKMTVKAGPVTVFRYEQDCRETWEGGQIKDLRCSTLKDGRRVQVNVTRTGEGLKVSGADGVQVLGADAMPTSWWARTVIDGSTLIDTQTGERIDAKVQRLGVETVTVNGQAQQATRYRVTGTTSADLWYDSAGRWVKCTFKARGSTIELRLKSPVDAAPTQA